MVTSSESLTRARGRFITFEGVDGAGKSTQVRLLAERLRARNVNVVTTREPGGTPGAEAIRNLLIDGPPERWDGLSEVLLFYAARRDHLERLVRPALARGDFVLCDRFADSSRAYQGDAGGVPAALLDVLDAAVLEDLKPDLTFILDLPVSESLARLGVRGIEGRFEARGLAYHERVRAAFRAIAEREPGRCRLVDAARPVAEVAEAIWKEVVPLVPWQARREAPS